MSNDKRLEILYSHYENVVANRRTQIRSRYRYLFFIVVLIVLFGLQLLYPKLVQSIFAGLAERFLNATIENDISVLETLLLGIFMVLVLRYLQISVGVERSYNDSGFLEDKIRCDFGVPIKTEGDAYLQDYPTILDTYDVVYKLAIPSVFLSVAAAQFVRKTPFALSVEKILNAFDVSFSIIIAAFVLLYWWFTYKGSIVKAWSKIIRSHTETSPVEDPVPTQE